MVNSNDLSFKPVPQRQNLSAALVETLFAQIESGSLVPGQQLPTEQEIIASAGVSRSVVREALASLKARGLVTTRQGLGAFVAQRPPRSFSIRADEVELLQDIVRLLELRIGIESEAAALAAERRSASDLREIDRRLETMDAVIRSGGSGAEEDYAFHAAVLAATHNPHFSRIFETFGSLLIPRSRIRLESLSAAERSRYLAMIQREHRAIRGAIKKRDPQAARAAAYDHLKSSRDRYRATLEKGA